MSRGRGAKWVRVGETSARGGQRAARAIPPTPLAPPRLEPGDAERGGGLSFPFRPPPPLCKHDELLSLLQAVGHQLAQRQHLGGGLKLQALAGRLALLRQRQRQARRRAWRVDCAAQPDRAALHRERLPRHAAPTLPALPCPYSPR